MLNNIFDSTEDKQALFQQYHRFNTREVFVTRLTDGGVSHERAGIMWIPPGYVGEVMWEADGIKI